MRLAALPLLALACVACQSAPPLVEKASAPAIPEALVQSKLTAREKADHVLARLGYGPRPGQVDDLVRGGDAAVWAFVLAQLHPERVDDATIDAALATLPTFGLSNAELREKFPTLNDVAKARGIDLGNDEQKRMLQNETDPDSLAQRVHEDLVTDKLVRAVESRRQLVEVLNDFWFNHFNVDVEKGEDRWFVTNFERETLRPHLFGHFRELLGAVAHSPAMLFYLDNWQSVREQGPNPRKPNAPARGINENYARELMELHTLGVNGGYTQADVREAARCLTGWTIEKPNKVGTFIYREKDHDEGPKTVLGVAFPPNGGEGDGEKLLDLLASSPATAHFLATKLARHFVADVPPPSLVDKLARRYLDTQGDLSEVYLTLFASPEFWARETYRAKVKTPLEMGASALRALDGHIDVAGPLNQEIGRMGERLFQCQPPTGYPDEASAWVNSGSLIERLNYGLRVASGKVPGVHGHILPYTPGRKRSDPARFIELASQALLQGEVTPETREVMLKELSLQSRTMPDGEVRPLDVGKLAGLLLGSPEFQKR